MVDGPEDRKERIHNPDENRLDVDRAYWLFDDPMESIDARWQQHIGCLTTRWHHKSIDAESTYVYWLE